MAEWSANMCGALTTHHQDIETYLTEELQTNIPAGESFVSMSVGDGVSRWRTKVALSPSFVDVF